MLIASAMSKFGTFWDNTLYCLAITWQCFNSLLFYHDHGFVSVHNFSEQLQQFTSQKSDLKFVRRQFLCNEYVHPHIQWKAHQVWPGSKSLENLFISAQKGLTLHLKFQRVQQYSQLFLTTVDALEFYISGPKDCFSWGFIIPFCFPFC